MALELGHVILALGVHGPISQKWEGPSRHGKLPRNSADVNDWEGHGTTHS